MASITGTSQSFLLNIQSLQNVNTSASGLNQINQFNNLTTQTNAVLKYINTTNGTFSINAIKIGNTRKTFIEVQSQMNFLSSIFVGGINMFKPNQVNGGQFLSLRVADIEKIYIPKTGAIQLYGDLHINNIISTISSGNLYVDNSIYTSSIVLGPFALGPRIAGPFIFGMGKTGNVAINNVDIATVDMFENIKTSSIAVGITPEETVDISGSVISRGNIHISSMKDLKKGHLYMDGSFGVGTYTPLKKVDIVGSEIVRGALFVGGITGDDRSGNINATGMIVASTLGINTYNPVTTVDINGSGRIQTNLFIGNIPDYYKFKYTSNSVYNMGGVGLFSSIGIGAVSTNATLEVNGNELLIGNLHLSTFGNKYRGRGNIYADGLLNISSIGIGIPVPKFAVDVIGSGVFRGNMYISSMADPRMEIGNLRVEGNIYAGVNIYSRGVLIPSDPVLKSNMRPYAYKHVLPEPVEFEWIQSGKHDIGVSAQDVLNIEPACVHTNAEGILHVDYPKLTVLCLAEIKELRQRVSDLERMIRKNSV